MKFWTGLVAGAALLSSAPAMAQKDPELPTRQVFICGGPIVGTVQGPTGSFVFTKPAVAFGTMIRLRTNFTPELDRSASQL